MWRFLVMVGLSATSCAERASPTVMRWLPIAVTHDGAPVDARPSGTSLPFRDRNRNGRFDPFVDPVGFCEPEGACSIPDRRVTVHRLRRNGPLGASAGVFVWAQDAAAAGVTLDVPVCTPDGTCSRPMALPFAGIPRRVHAWWTCTDAPEDETEAVVIGGDVFAVPPRPHVRVAVERGDGAFRVRASEAIDRMRVRLVRIAGGDVAEVSLARGPAMVVADREAAIRVPAEALAACPDCALLIQVMHVWDDGVVRDVSESWTTVPLTGGAA